MIGLATLQNVYTSSAAVRSSSTRPADRGLSFSEYLNGSVDGFTQENDNSESVEALFSYIKYEQEYVNYDRNIFDYDLDERVDNDDMAEHIIDDLAAAGVFKSEEDDEEEDEEAVDELLKAVKARQEAWKEERINRKSGFTVEEVKEVLSELKCVNSMTVK